ncbi:MFS transporter [Longirhabdus pacifica]|uniref:MFS transporter n=1 Tax=Longirhabdus pacifica TaxID=2305227 RepID=UPI0010092FCA|nr:MFS transporter [Longirhabdus pacifica]
MKEWKNPFLLILGIGISHLGNWIYFIALNILILNITGSAAAVAGLYVIRPIAVLLTNTWAGSVVDRVNKRKLMMIIDLMRGSLIMLLPFITSLWTIYALLLLIHMIGTFFGPSSSVYITKLVPTEKRKRFNSIMSMTGSGAFLLGPAIGGMLIMLFGTNLCIFINAITFFICACIIYFLPNIEKDEHRMKVSIHMKTILEDWSVVLRFAKKATFFITVYILFQLSMLIAFALDSQEVTFIKQSLTLSDQDYGLMVSIAGIGAVIGAAVSAMVTRLVNVKYYLGGGMVLASIGYIMFYASFNFISAVFSFVFLGFFIAFANTGYATFFQNNVPTNIMGRFGSIAEMIQAMLQIFFTLILGLASEWFSLQIVCLVLAVIGTIFATILFIAVLRPSKRTYFVEK